ncbi:DUF2752 domain-containing protein [Pengzhenrongella frigida]|uniref:DUF2752 domain-containing protein n=1 Tax=Pengzhenrongella frigida TaxID=1259133 RepID=A0A4Q5N394_9MICO|nr:DUF2752 domain-containing protein [Cellulomonas sp. HLT2-17]RYV52688.1 DUF2752 domain-containing protein [Cellulomonas sp. HLT2-17]
MSTDTGRRGPIPQAGTGRAVVVRAVRGPLVAAGLALIATAYVAAVDPNRPGHYVVCPLLTLTGLYCPACGGLRAVHDLTQLDLAGAWGHNPLLVLAAPLVVGAWGRWLVRSWHPGRWRPTVTSSRRSAWLAAVLLTVLVAYGVARNVPALAPWLAP